MKKGLITAFLPLAAASFAFGQQISATVNGNPVQFDVPPVELDGRVLVPVRGVFEQMGVNVDWQPATQTVYATGNGRTAELYIGKRVAMVNGQQVTMDVPAEVYHGRTMVPLRFVSESMGANVNWDAYSHNVAITTAMANLPPSENYPGNYQRDYPRQNYPVVTNVPRRQRYRNGERTGSALHTVVLQANTVVPLIMDTRLNSANARVGDRFTARVDTTNHGGSYLGLPAGTIVEGHVDTVRPMTSDAPGVLGLNFDRFVFPDGRTESVDGSLIGLESKNVRDENGRLVATNNASDRNLKYVGIGAGAGALIGMATKGNVVTSAIIGAALGYLYNQSQNDRRDVVLQRGDQFGMVLNQDVTMRV